MKLQLEGKRVLVTGSTSGIGEGIAKSFAQQGATVIVNGRREKEAQRVAEEIALAGGTAYIAVGDLATDAGAEQVINTINQELGGLDILVNNAGGGSHQADMEAPPEEWLASYKREYTLDGAAYPMVFTHYAEAGLGQDYQHFQCLGRQALTWNGCLFNYQSRRQ